jgi:hypothetical protein
MMRAVFLCLMLGGCSALTAASGALLGRGVNANVQAGAENRQALISQENAAPSVSIRPNSRTGDIRQEVNEVRTETIHTFNAGIPWWWWVILFGALWLDSPKRWPGQIWAALRRKKAER